MNPTNPLLNFSSLPQFQSFTIGSVAPAITELIADANNCITSVLSNTAPPTWDNVIVPLDDATEKMARAWGMVSHLNAVNNSSELREVYTAQLPAITQFWTGLSQNEDLFSKYKEIRASSGILGLSGTQNKVLDNEIRDFQLGGAELAADKKMRFQEIQASLATLMSTFNDNVLDATNAFTHDITEAHQLAGLPDDVVSAARELFEKAHDKNGTQGWRFSLHAPSYGPVMQYAAFHPLREAMYRAYVTRASELSGNSKGDNTAIISEILTLRAEAAALLGYQNYAEVSLAAKMATSPSEVIQFLNEMASKAKPYALADWDELVRYAKTALNMADVSAWDVAYVSEKLRESRYAFSDNEVKQYFPAHKAIDGLFRVVTSLYGVNFAEASTETWHEDVKFFSVIDANKNIIGQFYFDLYARDTKRGGAWMDDAINRRIISGTDGKIQHPVAYMTCNFSPPVNGKPALLTHDDVITLFHEFGHGLHQLLTEVDELSVSGISGVEWDAVELPSQFMENFCWEWDVLQHMTAHVDTGAALPRALFDKMLAAKNFQSGMGTLRQIEFALLDMHAHTDFDFAHDNINALAQRIRANVAVVPYPHFNRMPQSFAHIFGGGYAAGYYSYKWAEVLSADAYAAFEEAGLLGISNAETGARFRREVLARGGSRGAMESFVAFRGRKPEIEHLLRHNGMKLAA